MTKFKITVTSDTVCPWCFVGRKQLQAAEQIWKQRYPDSADTFAVSYQPYQLNPYPPFGPASSRSKEEFYREKFGAERAKMMHARVGAIGEAVGISFKFGGQTGSSRDSHRLVRLSKKYGNEVENKTIDGLFASYFEKEGDITNYDTLRSIAVDAGISEDDFQRAIVNSDEGGAEVDEAAKQARLGGVSGVPNYVVQDQFELQGANNPESFVRVFEKIKAREAQAGASI
ncbi:thioredoxin-like protein [Thelonectria olida]|uniref:Thioredoxin-like protein n=1 Tax=Thelonectria olida TaxID=1576542 RepID=A0A9P8W401_9HYPO|nr:thioredoxin-like protein [Thelonectria olida]